jgi:hypothetical protein
MKNRGEFVKKFLVFMMLMILIAATFSSAATFKSDKKTYSIENKKIKENEKNLKENFLENLKNTKYAENVLADKNILSAKKTSIFSTVVKTECENVEKTQEVFFGFKNKIDVDNNPDTGVNGKDIQVQYLLMPWFDFNEGIGFGLIFSLNVERIGEEVKTKNLSVTMETGWKEVSFGFWSPQKSGNTIPDSVSLSFGLMFYLTGSKHGFSINLNPSYSDGSEGKEIVLFSDHKTDNKRRIYSLHFDPAVETQVDVFSTKKQGEWQYSFNRKSSVSSTVTSTFSRIAGGERKDTSFIIDRIPSSMSFTLGLTPFRQGGGSFLYESSRSYDVEMIVESNQIGVCRYAAIRNTPNSLYAEWDPSLSDGYYSMDISSESTDFVLMNSLVNPSVNLEINDLADLDFDATWDLSNPGEFTIERETDFVINLDFEIFDWELDFYGKPLASYFYTNWYIQSTGYLEIDTNWEPLSEADLLIKSTDVGIRTNAETMKTKDFRLDWTVWPPKDWNVEKQGEIDFAEMEIEVFLQGQWYHLWPLSN